MRLKLQAVEELVELLQILRKQEGPQLLQLEEHQSLLHSLHKVEVLLNHLQLQVVEAWQDLLRLQVEGAHLLRDLWDQQ